MFKILKKMFDNEYKESYSKFMGCKGRFESVT